MSIAKITLYGMYQWDNTLFDDLEFPTSDLLDKETAVNQILFDCGEFEVLYSDWDFLKGAITQWGKKWYYTFQKWLEALEVEYDPLENYYRREHWTDDGGRENSSITNSRLTTTDTGEVKHSSRTYDNATMTEIERNNSSNNSTSNGTSGTEDVESTTNVRDGYSRGNIGVTTSQQMLLSSLELYKGFNLYEQISNIFKTDLCLMVYE